MTWPRLNYLAIIVDAVGATLLSGAWYAIFASTMAKLSDPRRSSRPGETTGSRRASMMPWPVFQSMTDQDLRAIYEYLSSIPHAEAGPPGP